MPSAEYSKLEDFVFSRSFRNWVLRDDAPEAEFWSGWAARNPDKTELINQAKAVIVALQTDPESVSSDAVDAEVRKVLQKLGDGRVHLIREIPYRPGILRRRPSRAWTIAAAIATVAVIAILKAKGCK